MYILTSMMVVCFGYIFMVIIGEIGYKRLFTMMKSKERGVPLPQKPLKQGMYTCKLVYRLSIYISPAVQWVILL